MQVLLSIFGSPHKKKYKNIKRNIRKKTKNMYSSEKRMPECPKNSQKLVEEV
jgi:hypothetical protein